MSNPTKPFQGKKSRIKSGRCLITPFLIAGIVLAYHAAGAAADDSGERPGIPVVMDLNVQAACPSIAGLPEDKKLVKGFNHAEHAGKYLEGNTEFAGTAVSSEFTCKACHQKAGSKEEILRTPKCDRLTKALTKAGGPAKLKRYFHNICRTCHKAMKKAGRPTGPVSCKGCHSKK